MPAPTAPAPSLKTCDGPIHAVPCPWCGKPNDFREIDGAIAALFEGGAYFECDSCHKLMDIVKVVQVKIVQVRQSKKTHNSNLPPNAAQPGAVRLRRTR